MRTPLYDKHVKLGARIVDFHGWELPIQYKGISKEHMAVRRSAGLFDVSHMGNFFVSGLDAGSFLSRVLTCNVADMKSGHAKYAHILDMNGMIIDDTIVTKIGDQDFMVVPNASMIKTDLDWFLKNGGKGLVEDHSGEYAIIALQGPKAQEIFQKLTNFDLPSIKFFRMKRIDIGGDCFVSRTGYTGEDGFEITTFPDTARKIWTDILNAGAEYGIEPIGLGARDTLRWEKGFLLSGQDFNRNRTTLETTYESWVTDWKNDFIGKAALLQQKEKGGYEKFVGIELKGKGIPRTGQQIFLNGKKVGEVTSGTHSPVMKKGIALGYVMPDHTNPGTEMDIEIRGKMVKGEIVSLPFVK